MLVWDSRQRADMKTVLQSPWFRITGNSDESLPEDIVAAIKQRREHSELKRLLLNKVAAKLQGDSLQYYTKLWNTADTNKSGHLSESEFTKLLTDSGMSQGQAQD